MWQIGKWLIDLNVRIIMSLYNFIKEIIGMMTLLEFILTMIFVGSIVLTFILGVIFGYLLLTGQISHIVFGVEGNEDRDVIDENEGGEKE